MKGKEIEEKSFEIIEERLKNFPSPEREVIKRIVHTTADFSLADLVVFHNDPVHKGIEAIKSNKRIFTDVRMVQAGITRYKGEVKCLIDTEEVKSFSESSGKTRAASAFQLARGELDGAIIAIGNAPTALLEVCSLIEDGISPSLVVGTPVGFVSAEESKERILQYDVPSIVVRGKRGGSNIAAAIINALIILSEKE